MSARTEKLRGKRIIVVGGSAGIGYGAAQALLESGALVTIISSSAANISSALSTLQSSPHYDAGNVTGNVGDVRDEAAFTALLVSLAPVDHIVFSSVDKIIRGPLASLDLASAAHLFGVKFWGSVVVGKAVAAHDIIRRGGSLTLTSGTAGIKPGKGASVGGALNGAVLSLTRGLASELAEKRVRVNTVVPGLVRTGLWDKMGASSEEGKRVLEESAATLPVGFVAGPADVSEAYVYLVRADYATGTLVEIDGGKLLL